ncbi:hypothetical protein [Rickettsiella endosymbiont of Xylota segnis]|uniref:hypothetical protein n=1 Tax=Rickettsiella endosymbiont of Xylota segnis TaxID=3066238 RepID=UPI0030D4E893
MTIENNNKTEAIKASLVVLLEKLENQKQIIATKKSYIIYIDDKIAPYDTKDKLELFNKATSTLSNLIKQFKSIDDFNSVKKLRQTELFFKNPDLKDFNFFSYKSLIEPNLLDHVNIEIRLDKLSKKADDLYRRGYRSEGIIVNGVETELKKLNHSYFEEKLIDLKDYKIRALTIIDEARPLLEQHRGCKKILGNLLLLIFTLGIAHIGNKLVNKQFFFFRETESSKQLNQLDHRVSKLNY